MVKLTKRKGFNFFRSYYDVYNELDNAQDKVDFIDALLNRQFLGVKPTDLKGMAKFAYISQTNSIDSQVKGYEDKTKTKLNPLEPTKMTPTQPPTYGGDYTPALQVEEKEKVQDVIINNKKYLDIILKDASYIEITAMQTKSNLETVIKYLKDFEAHLIRTSDQKNTIRDFKTHFTNWFNKQDIKKIVKIKKIDYGNVN